eukprot:12903272-Prorocentrum_lima.AAC.1
MGREDRRTVCLHVFCNRIEIAGGGSRIADRVFIQREKERETQRDSLRERETQKEIERAT